MTQTNFLPRHWRAPSIAALLLFASIFAAETVDGAFRIRLKNGKEFVTDGYWEEAGQIKFNYAGGVVGVPKDSIGNIEKTNLPAKTAPETPDETRVKEGAERTGIESYKAKRSELERKLEEASERHRIAIKNQDSEEKEKALQEMREISGQAMDLADELKRKNNGMLPDWWKEKPQ